MKNDFESVHAKSEYATARRASSVFYEADRFVEHLHDVIRLLGA